MDAVKFIEERNRMCESFDAVCTGCPAFNVCEASVCCAVDPQSAMDASAQLAIVEQWSATHPVKTRQSVFLEQWPEVEIDVNGVVQLCPMTISASHRDSKGECRNPEKLCRDCRREFWMQEIME